MPDAGPTTVPSRSTSNRWAWAEVDLDAVAHNVVVMRSVAAPADVWVVVKADGYGHGAIDVARTALEAGAAGLCVAFVNEGTELRRAGIDAPILLLSQQPEDQIAAILESSLIPIVYSSEWIARFADAVRASGRNDVGIHVKVDTGMQRVGAHPDSIGALLDVIRREAPAVRLAGLATHLATADQPDDPAADEQLDRFDTVLAQIPAALLDGIDVHSANSAGALAHPRARRSFVRSGIAVYGISPGHGVDHLCADLRPALSLHARVSFVKRVAAGSRISYGLRHTFGADTTVATLPIGYADGVPRRLSSTGGEVLVGGHRRPIVGVVTMDQLMVDVGDDPVEVGDPAVLLGHQGDERIRAEEWADRVGTIGYEIVCGITSRVERRPRRSITH